MDRIRRLELFVRAVDTGSFAKAAASFEITPSGVSRAIAELEKQLGVALFHRTTRHLVVTEEGSELYQRGREILEKLDEVEGALANEPSSPKGTLRVGLNVPISRHVVMPTLATFIRKYPGLRLAFEILNSPQEMYAEGIDLLLRIGEPPDSDLVARKIAQIQYGLYASPTYIANAGTVSQPEDLIHHICLVHKPPWQAKPFDEWEFERNGESRSRIDLKPDYGQLSLSWTGESMRRRRLAPRGREPRRQIAHVYLDMFESAGLALDGITLRLCDKARRTCVRVPVVICEVVEARVGHPTAEKVSVDIPHPIEGNRKVEYPPRR